MKEYFTEALILDKEPSGEFDARIHLYTKELGRIAAKVTSVRKIISKLNAHLEPLNLIDARIVNKNNFQIVDALKFGRLPSEFLPIVRAIKELTAEGDPDFSLWTVVSVLTQKNQANLPLVLKVLGYDPKYASCDYCGGQPQLFSLSAQTFRCDECAAIFDIRVF